MKKRFTVMLEERVINLLKKVATHKCPSTNREDIEVALQNYAYEELEYYGDK